MGCLFTKNKTRQYSSHAPRQIQVQKISINGTAQTNGPDVKPTRGTEKQNGVDGLPGKIASAAKQPSARALSPRPEPTLPPTPEEDRLPHSVQYAEDLEPVTPLPDVITVATLTPKRNRIDVSTVSFTSSEPSHRKNTMLSNNDVTIEDLDTGFDTDLDRYSRFRLVYNRPLRPLSESHIQRNKTFVVKNGASKVKRPASDYASSLTRPSS